MSTANSPSDSSAGVSLAEVVVRLAALERQVQQLSKEKTVDGSAANSDRAQRWEQVLGSMKDDPEFAEVLRLGREYRKSHFTD